jgi:hypothetical protein
VSDWLFEGSVAVYVLLGGTAALMLSLWWRSRRRRWLYGAAGAAALIGVYFLLGRFVDTDKKRLERTIETMAAAVRAHDVDVIFEHVSEQFRSPQGRSKEQFRELVRGRINGVQSFTIRRLDFPEGVSRSAGTARAVFLVNVDHPEVGRASEISFRCEATFDFDPQRGWRLRVFRLFSGPSMDELPLPL